MQHDHKLLLFLSVSCRDMGSRTSRLSERVCIVPGCVAVLTREVMCGQYSVLKVGLPRLCSCSVEMLFYLPSATS